MANFMYSLSVILSITALVFIVFIFFVVLLSLSKKRFYGAFAPKVSVVIPTYNEGEKVKQSIDSVLASDYKKEDIEIIVVDDGSDDDVFKTLSGYKDIKVIKQEHLGKTYALNNGINNSKNEFIIIVDADTIVETDFIKQIVRPFSNDKVGATTGIVKVYNHKGLLPMFQNVEYSFYNIIRHSFSDLFNNSAWFLGALACYRKSVLEKVGLFKDRTITEDIDLTMEISRAGYKNISVSNAYGYTEVPTTLKRLYKQRARWWVGVLQVLFKNKDLISLKSGRVPISFLFFNQIFWSLYAILYFPVLIYQFNYWLPYNIYSLFAFMVYFVRWFSLWGVIYVLYNIPNNGISLLSIFGVLTGLLVTLMIFIALKRFDYKIRIKDLVSIFFFFPYTIILNIIILLSLFNLRVWRRKYFKR